MSWSLERRSSSSGTGVGFQIAEFLDHALDNFDGRLARGARIDAHGAGVAIRIQVAVDGVGESLALANILEQARAHAASEQRIQDVGGVAAFVRHGMRRDADADLHLLQRFLVAQVDARKSLGLGRVQAVFRGLHVPEMFFDKLDKVFVIEVSGRADDEIAGREVVSVEAVDHGTLEFLHGVARAQNRQAEGVVLPETLGEDFVDEVVGIVLIHFYFFENDAALLRDVAGIEDGMEDEIAEDIHGERKMLVENFDVEADAFLRRECVHVAADRIDLAGDGFGGAGLGSLEDHVLDEVGDAVEFGIFVARAGLQPDADRDRANVGHLLGDNGQAVRQDLTTNAARFFYHEVLVKISFAIRSSATRNVRPHRLSC